MSPTRSDTPVKSPSPALSEPSFPVSPTRHLDSADDYDPEEDPPLLPHFQANSDDTDERSSETSTPPPPPTLKQQQDVDDDTRSLGSLDTETLMDKESLTRQKTSECRQLPTMSTRALTPLPINIDSMFDDAIPFDSDPMMVKDSFQVQRAKDIILKKVKEENNVLLMGAASKEDTLLDDGQSDVVSSVLVGLDIDIDLPPASPISKDGHSGGGVGFRNSFLDLAVAKSASIDKPFDEKSLSQTSSRERSFDESSVQRRGGLKARAGPHMSNTLASTEGVTVPSFDDSQNPSQANLFVSASFSDLTSTFFQPSTSSQNMNDRPADFKWSTGFLPPLLRQKDEEVNSFIMAPPPPPPLPSSPPSQIDTSAPSSALSNATQATTLKKGLQDDANEQRDEAKISSFDAFSPDFPTERKLITRAPNASISPKSEGQLSPVFFDTGYKTEKEDDGSSDPFEGYEDFDAEDFSASEAASPSYSGYSESEQGYTRFARQDYSSGDDESIHSSDDEHDSLDENDMKDCPRDEEEQAHHHSKAQSTRTLKHKIIICDDSRQPSQALDSQPDFALSGRRESPGPSVTQGHAYESFATDAVPGSESSRILTLHENDDDTPKEAQSLSTTTPTSKKSRKIHGFDVAKTSPGNRIVRALSKSIRLRRKSKSNRALSKQSRFEALQTDAEAKVMAAETTEEQLPSVKDEVTPAKAGDTSVEDDLSQTDAAVEELEEDDTLGRPIQFISMSSASYDDGVSQITFTLDDNNTKSRAKNSQWWGQLGQLDDWLPNFHQAVEAAEGFLSAKAIHAQMKSRPLDFDSEDEEDTNDDLIVRESRSGNVGACSPIPNTFFDSSNGEPYATRRSSANRSFSLERFGGTTKATPSSPKTPLSNDTPQAPLSMQSDIMYVSQSKSEIATEIEAQEKLLAQFELDALNDDKANQKVSSTLFRLSILFLQSQQLEEALKSTNEALRIQRYLGDSADAARSLHLLADIFVRKGEYESALSCYAEVQETELELYGYIHEESANTLNRIGSVFARQSKFRQAMEKHQEALRILKECHGEELRHPLVSQTLIHIGAVYYRERNSLATVRSNSDDYTTFIEVGMLEVIGRAHEDRGSYKMAISFFEEKLQYLKQKRKDGIDTREDVAATLNSLGMLSCRAGIFMEAIDYYDRALEVQKQIGCDKMHIATARVLTATVQFHLGYFQKALRLLQDALKELKAEAGDEHETVAATWFQIGVVQVALCEYDSGMDALEEALRIQNKLLGKVHPASIRTRREIGNMYAIYESELDAAFAQFRDILTLQRRIHGHKHPNVAETLHSLGCAYARKGDFPNAIKTLEECYYTRIDFLGADHPLQATTLHEIAEIHRKRQRYRKAKHICNAVLEIRKESLSERHIDVARALATKASCMVALGDYNGAMKCLRDALPMAEQAVGEAHPAVADILLHLAGLHLRRCQFDEAKEWISKALDIYQNSNLDEDHPSFKDALALMERVDRDEMLCV
jgi:tetratricopeptide (TPR) repeat protein